MKRLTQLREFTDTWPSFQIWFGGLFYPVAFLAAAKESIAHQQGWPIEQMRMCSTANIHIDGKSMSKSIVIGDCLLSCAQWSHERNTLECSSSLLYPLNCLRISWTLGDASSPAKPEAGLVDIELPVYADSQRSQQLFSVALPCAEGVSETLHLRGACLLLNNV